MSAGCPVIVFAKAPVPGTVKTRLAAAIGMEAAARLAERMLAEAVARALEAAVGPVALCCAPDASHPAFARLAARAPVALCEQGDGGLGERMHRAFCRFLAAHDRAIVIGTDAPALDAAYLRDAAARLTDHAAVIGPALDGGYTLIGLRQPTPELFAGIAWSTPQVLTQTRMALRRLGIAHAELAALADVDEPDDLRHVPAAWHPTLAARS
jgi:rSAM/selenodomain-associated transferase 1